jgi:hypothetical protein
MILTIQNDSVISGTLLCQSTDPVTGNVFNGVLLRLKEVSNESEQADLARP